MSKRAIFPPGSEDAANAIRLSPAIVSGQHVFLTGLTGSRPDGSMPEKLEEQFRSAFEKIGAVLKQAGLSFDNVVEMTSYHVDLKSHFDAFETIRAEFVTSPYPAWTAVEVAGLRRPGAVVEIKVVASLADDT